MEDGEWKRRRRACLCFRRTNQPRSHNRPLPVLWRSLLEFQTSAFDFRALSSICHLPFSILALLFLVGCQAPPPKQAATAPSLNYTAYLYSLYDTEVVGTLRESVKEDRLEFARGSSLVVARLGEYAPREPLLASLRQHTNLFSGVSGIPAVWQFPVAPGGTQTDRSAAQTAVRDHLVKMRQLALDLGGNYLCLIDGQSRTVSDQTPIGVLDLTIIGYFVIGSHRTEVESRGSAALVDIASGRPLVVVTEQQTFVRHFPSASVEKRNLRLLVEANEQLENNLTRKMLAQLRERMGGE